MRIAHVYNGSTISIYVDGVLDNSEPETGSIPVTSYPFTIAAYTLGGKWYFPGTIDEFRIFSHALSPEEILDDYTGMNTTVGGICIPVNKLSLLAPYIGLTILLAVAVMTVVYVKKRKKHTETNS